MNARDVCPAGTLTAVGGGAGGNHDGMSGNAGGSGGGAWYTGSNAAGTSGQGNSGGGCNEGNDEAPASSCWCGGGGGGAGASPGRSRFGGAGLSVAITGAAVTYATGGTADCYPSLNADASGAANTGNGASGAGSGGSGVVIVAYPGPALASGGAVSTTSRAGYTVHTFSSSGTLQF